MASKPSILIRDETLNRRLEAIAFSRKPPSTKTEVARAILDAATASIDMDNPDRFELPSPENAGSPTA